MHIIHGEEDWGGQGKWRVTCFSLNIGRFPGVLAPLSGARLTWVGCERGWLHNALVSVPIDPIEMEDLSKV